MQSHTCTHMHGSVLTWSCVHVCSPRVGVPPGEAGESDHEQQLHQGAEFSDRHVGAAQDAGPHLQPAHRTACETQYRKWVGRRDGGGAREVEQRGWW